MKKKITGLFKVGRRFKKEFRRQIRLVVVITLAFTIAFSWRQTVFDISQNFVEFITNIQNSSLSSILTSTFITLLSILIIYLLSYLLKDPEDNNGY